MRWKLLILGAGQYGAVARELAESVGCFDRIDHLDDRNKIAIDRLEHYAQYVENYSHAIVAIGNAEVRLSYLQKLEAVGFQIPTLISPRAYIAPSAKILKGSIVEPMTVINANAVLSVGVIACAGVTVNHDAVIGDGCLLQCGSIVKSGARMPRCFVLDYAAVYGSTEPTRGETTKMQIEGERTNV